MRVSKRVHIGSAALTGAALVIALTVAALARQGAGVHPLTGRVFAGVMGVEGADWLDRSNRESEEAPSRALEAIKIQQGSVVADVGAGSGYYTLRLAALVGPSGKVYATDIQRSMLNILRGRLRSRSITTVDLILSAVDDPKLPAESIDLALLVDVYHEFSAPQAMLQGLRRALKADGRLVLLEFRKEDPKIPIRPEHKMSVAEAKVEVEAEGFQLAETNESLPWQHILVFRKR